MRSPIIRDLVAATLAAIRGDWITLKAKMGSVDETLTGKIDRVSQSLDKKIDALESGWDARVDKAVKSVEARLDAKEQTSRGKQKGM